jgi:hypothetical protein
MPFYFSYAIVILLNITVSVCVLKRTIRGESTFITHNWLRLLISLPIIIVINFYIIYCIGNAAEKAGFMGVAIIVVYPVIQLFSLSPLLSYGLFFIIADFYKGARFFYKGPTKLPAIEKSIAEGEYQLVLDQMKQYQSKYPYNIYINQLSLEIYEKLKIENELASTISVLIHTSDDEDYIQSLLNKLETISVEQAFAIRKARENKKIQSINNDLS